MRTLRWMATAVGFTVMGVAGTLLVIRLTAAPPAAMVAPAPMATPAAPTPAPADAGDNEILIPPDVVARAALKTGSVGVADVGAAATLPGTVMPNAYREGKVTPIAGGIVTKNHPGLGVRGRR